MRMHTESKTTCPCSPQQQPCAVQLPIKEFRDDLVSTAADVMPWIVAYPADAKPLLINTTYPEQLAWLPENVEQDYCITLGKDQKYTVFSHALGIVKHVACLYIP